LVGRAHEYDGIASGQYVLDVCGQAAGLPQVQTWGGHKCSHGDVLYGLGMSARRPPSLPSLPRSPSAPVPKMPLVKMEPVVVAVLPVAVPTWPNACRALRAT